MDIIIGGENGIEILEISFGEFDESDRVIILGSRCSELFIVSEVITVKGAFEYKVFGNNTKNKLTVKEKQLKLPNVFWFINSSGKIVMDFEERSGIDAAGLEFKKNGFQLLWNNWGGKSLDW